ncbi:MAG: sensor histidine kinase [Lachnospiraceae bacterium]
MICITEDKEMGMILPIILYALDIAKYWIGNRLFFKGKMKSPWLPVMGAAGILISFTFFSVSEAGRIALAGITAAVIAGVMIDESIVTKIIRIVWLECIVSFLDGAMVTLFGEILVNEQTVYVIGSLFTLLIIAFGGYILNKIQIKFSASKMVFRILYAMLILVCTGISYTSAAIQIMYEDLPKELQRFNLNYVFIVSSFVVTLLLISIFYVQKLYDFLQKVAETERKLNQLQKTYYQGLLDKEEETRRYRHDMHNHLLYIGELAKSENAGQTAEYVESLEEKWNKISKKHYETGNMTLNILLDHYLADLEGVKISVVGALKRELEIEEVDLCTIFSNLIQNAVEELKGQEGDKRFFSLEIRQGRENTSITLRNSAKILVNQNEELKTDKKDKRNHGIGLKNVEEMVKYYSGEFSWEANGEEFKAVVLMKG